MKEWLVELQVKIKVKADNDIQAYIKVRDVVENNLFKDVIVTDVKEIENG